MKCDDCGKEADSLSFLTEFFDPRTMNRAEWLQHRGKHLCPKCFFFIESQVFKNGGNIVTTNHEPGEESA